MDMNFSRWSLATLFHFKAKVQRQPVRELRIPDPFHAVGVVCESPCNAARRLQGARFLSPDAPSLPLPACDATACLCRYQHFKDRRGSDRRRREVLTTELSPGGQERRRRDSGRRITDQ